MSEVKHTPGPWKVLCVPTLHEWETKKYFVAAVPYEGHPYYQRTRYFDIAGDEEYPTKAADLRLIAAAPALLEALESALLYADHLPTCGQHMNLPCDCDFHTERRKWEAALVLAHVSGPITLD